jgi:predicted porin
MKKMYAVGAVIAVVCAVNGSIASTSAVAADVKSDNDTVSVSLYGQVNRAIMVVDDGEDSEFFHVDNDNSSSRIGLKAKAKPSEDLTVGAKFEVEFQSNPSNEVNFEDGSISAEFKERHIDFYVDSNFGKLSLGQGDMASNGSAEVDLSKTNVIGYSSIEDVAGGIVFFDNVSMSYSGVAVADVFDNMDGLSRKDRVRYDTPKFAGFTLSASAGEDDAADIAATYEQKFGETTVAAAIAYGEPGTGKDYTILDGSASVLFDFGLNLTVAMGQKDLDDAGRLEDDPSYIYGKIGYLAKLTDIGYTAFSVDYGSWEDIDSHNSDEEADSYGIQIVQQVKNWGTELYAQYRIYELDQARQDYEDIGALIAGARIKF